MDKPAVVTCSNTGELTLDHEFTTGPSQDTIHTLIYKQGQFSTGKLPTCIFSVSEGKAQAQGEYDKLHTVT